MTYIVNSNCIKCKLTDCVEVCPVDCFYEGENMLVIDPDICIDCGVCEPECPIEAIVSDSDLDDNNGHYWLVINTHYSKRWPNITDQKDPLEDHEKWNPITNPSVGDKTNLGIFEDAVPVPSESIDYLIKHSRPDLEHLK